MTPFKRKIRSLSREKFLPYSYHHLPPRIQPEPLEELVKSLRTGNTNVINSIIEGHLRLGIHIVSRYGSKYRTFVEELIGVMDLSFVENTRKAVYRLTDNNITPYLIVNLHSDILEFIENNHIVNVPGRTVRYYAEKGDQRLDNLPVRLAMYENTMDRDSDDGLTSDQITGGAYIVPQVINHELRLIEVNELLDKSAHTIIEKKIIELRAQGYTYQEIVPKVGYSTAKISIIVNSVEEQFYKKYKNA